MLGVNSDIIEVNKVLTFKQDNVFRPPSIPFLSFFFFSYVCLCVKLVKP